MTATQSGTGKGAWPLTLAGAACGGDPHPSKGSERVDERTDGQRFLAEPLPHAFVGRARDFFR